MAKTFIKRRRNDVVYAVLLCLYRVSKYIPRKFGLLFSGWIGRFVFFFPTKDKQRTIRHLTRFYSTTWSEKKIKQVAAQVYVNAAKNLFDAMHLTHCSNDQFDTIVKHDDLSAMQHAYDQGKGVIAILSHSGCYEMNGHMVARKGFRCITIGQKMFDKRIDRLIVTMRRRNNVTYLHRDRSSREVLRFLKNGGFFGVLLDQDTYGDGVFTHFLGVPAYTPSGPMRMAMRFDMPVFVVYSARQKDDTHYVYIKGPLTLENTGDFDRDIVMNIEKVNDFLSKGVLQFPEQWVWMHRRWKRTPEKYKDVLNSENYI